MVQTQSHTKRFAVVAHRYVGLGVAVFLMVAGVTGSVLTFAHELDAAINPGLLLVRPPTPATPPLAPTALRESLLRVLPTGSFVNTVPLDVRPGEAAVFFATYAGTGPDARDDQFFVDPYTGGVLGSRRYGEVSQGTKNLMPFIYKLHASLALGSLRVLRRSVSELPADNLVPPAGDFESTASIPPPNLVYTNNGGLVARTAVSDAAGAFALRIDNGPTRGWTGVSWPLVRNLAANSRIRLSALVRVADTAPEGTSLEFFLNDGTGQRVASIARAERINRRWQRIEVETSVPAHAASKQIFLVALVGSSGGAETSADVLVDNVSLTEVPSGERK